MQAIWMDYENNDVNGFDENEFDANGLDANGFDENGFDANGFDANGFDQMGFDENVFDENDCDEYGLHKNWKGPNNGYRRMLISHHNCKGYNGESYSVLLVMRKFFDESSFALTSDSYGIASLYTSL